jgi:hypothetical protein
MQELIRPKEVVVQARGTKSNAQRNMREGTHVDALTTLLQQLDGVAKKATVPTPAPANSMRIYAPGFSQHADSARAARSPSVALQRPLASVISSGGGCRLTQNHCASLR